MIDVNIENLGISLFDEAMAETWYLDIEEAEKLWQDLMVKCHEYRHGVRPEKDD